MLNLVAWPSFQRVMAGTGLLALESSPTGADVVFDARAVGTTNLTLRGGLGRHLVELWRGGKLLRKQWVEIQLSPGRLALDVTPAAATAPLRLPADIHEVFRSRAVQIQACYERRLKNNPSLEGRLTLRVELDKAGRVARAAWRPTPCPTRALASARWPSSDAGSSPPAPSPSWSTPSSSAPGSCTLATTLSYLGASRNTWSPPAVSAAIN